MGGDSSTRMSQYTPEQRARLLDAMQRHEGWRPGTVAGGGSGGGTGGPLTTDGPIRANLMHGQYGAPGSNLATLRSRTGRSIQVHAEALPSFQGFLSELEAQGYNVQSLGGHAHRNERSGNRLSQHAFGNAIDLNPGRNPLGTSITDMPENVRALAKKYGLIWGMDWKGRKDPMHFEWNGTRPWLEAQRSVNDTKAKAAQITGQMQDVGDGIKSTGWKRVGPAGDGAAGPGAGLGAGTPGQSLGQNAPLSNRGTPGASIRGGGGRIGDTNTHITVNGYQKDGKELSNEIQRSLQNDMNRRTHDFDGFA